MSSSTTASSSSTIRLRAAAVGALALPLALGAAACSSEDVADKVAEKIAESAADEDVDVDFDSDSGEFSVETEDGSSSFSVGGAEMPDGWPEEVPLPEGFTPNSSFQTDSDGTSGFSMTGSVPGDAAEAFEELAARFEAEGWTEQHRSTSSFGDGSTSNASYENGTWQVVIGTTHAADEDDLFSYTVVSAEN